MSGRFTPYARGLALSALGMLVISPDGLLMRLLEDASAWNAAFYRAFFMGVSISVFLLVRNGVHGTARSARALGWPGIASGLLVAVANVAFVMALLNTTVANTLLVLATMPLWSALLGWVLIRERVRPRTGLAIGIGFTGIAVILAGNLGLGGVDGIAFAAVAAAAHGLSLVALRRAGGGDTTPVLVLGGFGAAAVALPFADPLAVTRHDLLVLALLGLVVLPAGLALFISGTRTVPAAEVALLALVETTLGPFWTWLGVGEVPAPATFAGGVLVFGAIVLNALLALRERKRRGAPADARAATAPPRDPEP